MFEFTDQEWRIFSKTERRIIIFVRQYGLEKPEDRERIRQLLDWPDNPMHDRTFANHWGRLMKKMSVIRKNRSLVPTTTVI